VLAWMGRNKRTVLCHNLGFAFIAFCSYGTSSWIPSFFVRTFGWSPAQVGLVFGSIVMVAGASGIVFGGRLCDRLQARGVTDAPMRVGLWSALALLPLTLLYTLTPSPDGWLSAIFLFPATFAVSMPFGVAPSAIQEIMPNAMRGQASAVYLFIVNAIGLGIGPSAVAIVNDYLFHDEAALRWSMALVVTFGALCAAGLLAAGMKPYRDSVVRVRELLAKK
jgi:sugar phosphate permease